MYRKIFALAALLTTLALPMTATAASASTEETSNAPQLTYTVTPVFPDNQDDSVSSYYSLSTDDDTLNQELTVKVTNTADVEQSITVTPVNAYTSANGVIQYTDEESGSSSILDENYEMVTHLTTDNTEITLAPQETRNVVFDLNVDNVEGTVLGGIAFSTLSDESETGDGISIRNKVNTVLGVSATLPSDEIETGELTTGGASVSPMPSYYTVDVPLHFDVSDIATDSTIEYAVNDGDTELFTGEQVLDFAPKTTVNYAVPLDIDNFEQGKEYVISGKITYERSGENVTVPFSSTFSHEGHADDPDFKNPDAEVTAPADNDNSMLWILGSVIGALVLALVAALLMLWKRSKKN